MDSGANSAGFVCFGGRAFWKFPAGAGPVSVRFVFIVLYVLGMYAVMLTENIFSVASIRTIQLFRAARSVSFILALIVSLLFFSVAFSLKLPFYLISILVG